MSDWVKFLAALALIQVQTGTPGKCNNKYLLTDKAHEFGTQSSNFQ